MAMTVVLQQVGLPAEEREVTSLEDASKAVVAWQDERGLGASQLTPRHGSVRLDGKYHARISYNGKVTGGPEAVQRTVARMAAEVMLKTGGPKR